MDLGSPNLIAGKADGAENVIRVKATVKNFRNETNMSVITEDGSFYTFNVKYADEPLILNVERAGQRKPDAGTPHHEVAAQGGQAQGEAHRLQAFRHPVPAERDLCPQ